MKAIYVGSAQDRPKADPLGRRPVNAVMTSPVICVTGSMSLGDALRTMVNTHCRHLVVVDADGHCRGVLADRAVAAAWAHNPDALGVTPVISVLDPNPALVGESTNLAAVASRMRSAGVDAVAVVDVEGRPVGIVTGSDLVALLAT
jgi:predicted transcriptional regulator